MRSWCLIHLQIILTLNGLEQKEILSFQERKFVGGSQQVCLKIANELGERVHLNSAVLKVQQDEAGDVVIIKDIHGAEYQVRIQRGPARERTLVLQRGML